MTSHTLELRDVTLRVAGRALLASVNLTVGSGELVAIVGRNGAGKSTLLRLLAGLLTPSEGRATLDGRPLESFSPRVRAALVGFLAPASLPVPTGFTVRDAVGFARFAAHDWWRSTAVDDPLVARAIADLGLGSVANRTLETLSDGERQRAWLAALHAQGAGLVLLDEPTSHLDVEHQRETLATLTAWTGAGRGVVVVLHDLDAALAVADRLVLVDAGRIVFDLPAPSVDLAALTRHLRVPLVEIDVRGQRRVLVDDLSPR